MPKSSIGALLLFVQATGCGLFFRAPAPIAAIPFTAQGDVTERELLVLLPGRGDRASSYVDQGIVRSAREADASLDVVAVDATLGYYIHRNLPERLMTDVVEPAKARGYRSIWLGGISMGGLGALLFAQRHPGAASDVLVVAPFLGDPEVIEEIERAGGVATWRPPATHDPEDYQRELWRWLKGCTIEARPACPRIFLGFGTDDRFARSHRLLASVLPPEQVATVPGGHTWEPWQKLFATLLPRLGPGHTRPTAPLAPNLDR